ncbi:MAG: DNA mismatch repair protein MutS [Planctomycetes bacterium]|jgi:DNA mismatch repair protein MutS|nr:DNA mismatch repair protein MutS [Planctomycetota bacterium]
MMEQFWRAKKEQPAALLFFRMGDFYELFHDDAVVASRELGLALTARSKGDDAIPMAGVPVKSAEGYILKLVRRGHRVAICEQVSDPRTTKGIVDRAIVRVVTAGTLTEEEALDARRANFLAALHVTEGGAGLAWVDVSTGRFFVAEAPTERLEDELARVGAAEALISTDLANAHPRAEELARRALDQGLVEREAWEFDRTGALRALKAQFQVSTLEGFGIDDDSPCVPAAGALLAYLEETQRGSCSHLTAPRRFDGTRHLVLDRATRSCLELTATQRDGSRAGTLLDVIDGTQTPMGGRLLHEWLVSPLTDVNAIAQRRAGVAELVDGPFLRDDLRGVLAEVRDIERLTARVSTGRAHGRDLVSLAASLSAAPVLRAQLKDANSTMLAELHQRLDPLLELVERIGTTLVDQPPLTIREGNLIRRGFHDELDELYSIAGDGKSWMASFQAAESERTGIANLKIGFNSVFGYFIEVPRGQADRTPEHYIRKQTIKTAERYITPELKEFETKVLRAEERSRDLEYRIFTELRDAVAEHVARILATAQAIAELDVLAGLAQKAAEQRYVAPTVDEGDTLEIIEGRHPVIEQLASADAFVPNDTRLNRDDSLLITLTGPNMSGKSTWIRQTALIVLLAQIGSFVPAQQAHIGVVDRIFTRIGAGDDIGRGASTFMVEMVEIANILNNASDRSLIVLDEVGRGTSTFDGLALAWAIVEHIHEKIRARTLFATHYHQLTELAERLAGVRNMSVAVREWEDEIVFLHRIVAGGTDRSYGIHVARLAGVPPELLARAKGILHDIETDAAGLGPRIASQGPAGAAPATLYRPRPAAHDAVLEALRALETDRMTPLEALLELQRLRGLAEES